MNKILKYLLGVFGIFLIGVNLCNADLVDILQREQILTGSSTVQEISGDYYGFYKASSTNCYYCEDNTKNNCTKFNQRDLLVFTGKSYVYCSSTTSIFKFDLPQQTCPTCPTCPTIDSNYCTSNNLCPSCPSCPTCEEQYTSLECQTEYNLIPISSITQSYCELNYNLIDPSTCPINEGTGVVNWSSLFINNTQYAGNDNIEIFIPDFIGWSIIYNSGSNYIDIEGYNADTEYIENVINKEKLTPTKENVSQLVNGLQEFAPYILLSLLLGYLIYMVKKLFK